MKHSQTVLVVEDDTWFAEHYMRILESAGFAVRHAPDGVAAIEAIDDKLPDAIVLDLFLPGPNALVLLHEIQSHQDLAQIPVVMCTASALGGVANGLSAYGVTDVLDKGSMQPIDLIAAVKRALL